MHNPVSSKLTSDQLLHMFSRRGPNCWQISYQGIKSCMRCYVEHGPHESSRASHVGFDLHTTNFDHNYEVSRSCFYWSLWDRLAHLPDRQRKELRDQIDKVENDRQLVKIMSTIANMENNHKPKPISIEQEGL
jgi:hypothetical protein